MGTTVAVLKEKEGRVGGRKGEGGKERFLVSCQTASHVLIYSSFISYTYPYVVLGQPKEDSLLTFALPVDLAQCAGENTGHCVHPDNTFQQIPHLPVELVMFTGPVSLEVE